MFPVEGTKTKRTQTQRVPWVGRRKPSRYNHNQGKGQPGNEGKIGTKYPVTTSGSVRLSAGWDGMDSSQVHGVEFSRLHSSLGTGSSVTQGKGPGEGISHHNGQEITTAMGKTIGDD